LVVAGATLASFLTSMALLGGTSTAMILGHWYLVLPSMEVSLLQSIVKFHIGATALRILVVASVVWWATTAADLPGPEFARYILSLDGVFFWQRILFGLLGPVVLAYMTWETAKIRSTQSATGILYVDFFTVIVGEVLAKYILVTTSIPV
jgi:protein NrfD